MVLDVGWVAACMEPDEWADWQRLNPAITDRADRPCRDCPLSFAREMRALGRCNGIPRLIDSGGPVEELTTVDVVSQAPCRRCSHQNVCSMRATVEGLRKLDVALPDVPKAVRVIVTAEIECSEFLKARGATSTASRPAKRPLSPKQVAHLEDMRSKLAEGRAAAG